MMPNVTIYHNPRCSKSRQTLSLLQEQGIKPVIVEYLKNPPSTTKLTSLLKCLALKPRQLLRTKEAVYKALKLDNQELGDRDILKAMTEHPELIERPIVVSGHKAAIGRPPENVLEILK